jgi:hypothetical protein
MKMIEARVKELEKAVDALIEERDAYHEENEKLREVVKKLAVWEDAYPEHMFSPINLDLVDDHCKKNGYRIDNISATILREIIPQWSKLAREALSKDKVIFFDKVKDEYISCNIESCFYFDEKHEQNCCYSIPEKCCYRKISKDKGEI